MSPATEPVFTVSDFYDGPREGAASYRGRPHVFRCLFDAAIGDWSEVFLLKSIAEHELKLVLEDWAIWLSWYRAWRSGRVALSSHACLPQDRSRKLELQRVLSPILQIEPATAIRVKAHFSGVRPEEGVMVVAWQQVE
jgi:hypothetical protein